MNAITVNALLDSDDYTKQGDCLYFSPISYPVGLNTMLEIKQRGLGQGYVFEKPYRFRSGRYEAIIYRLRKPDTDCDQAP